MKKKLLMIDGHNLLFQMFFGMPSQIINKNGKAIQGTTGFIGALIKIIKMVSPTHLVVLFDSDHENNRMELLSDYKANRIDYSQVPEENNPFSQLADIYHALDFMNIKHAEAIGFEADDVIASYSHTYEAQMKIVISSFDSDFFQLISDDVSILRYRGVNSIICDKEYLQDKYGILPSQYVDFKSLTGDSADNIKGADKVGPKTASLLMNQFGTLGNVLHNAEFIAKPSIRQSIIQNTQRLKNNYELIKFVDTVDLPFVLDELIYNYDGISTTEVLRGINLK